MRIVESEAGSLIRVSARVPGLSPWRFLRWAGGESRGFWARGDRWLAHSGSVLTLEPPFRSRERGDDRFESVRRTSLSLRDDSPTLGGFEDSELPSPRFFGGFSFGDGHDPSGVWSGFPAARFVLPALEVRGKPEGVRIILQELYRSQSSASPAERRKALETRLAGIVHELGEEEGREGGVQRSPLAAFPFGPPEAVNGNGWGPWRAAVDAVLRAVSEGQVSKVVLARTLDVPLESGASPLQVLERLYLENHASHVFLFEPVPGAAFLGAAPETVATLEGSSFEATAVAGSAPAGTSEEDAREQGQRLLASEKDRREHAVTTREMLRCLSPLMEELKADAEPHVLRLPGIQHLETRVHGTVRSGEHVLSLLAAVHPTPAVCGLPREEALRLIQEVEPFERGWYAGPVGWFDLEGDGIFAPALRSAVHGDGRWRLFAGAGLVEGSRPDAEWEETGMKFDPVLRALGVGVR